MSDRSIIERTAGLIAALGGARSDDEANVIASRLAEAANPSLVADALVEALEANPPLGPWRNAHWTIGTAAAALFAIAGSTLGLSAIADTLALGPSLIPILPLALLPLIVAALIAYARGRARRSEQSSEAASVAIALRLLAAGVPEPVARATAAHVTDVATEAYGAAELASPSRFVEHAVGVAAALAVLLFWIGYFAALRGSTVAGGW